MSKGLHRNNREAKKPKQLKPKVLATAGMATGLAAGLPSKTGAATRGKSK